MVLTDPVALIVERASQCLARVGRIRQAVVGVEPRKAVRELTTEVF